MHLFFFSLGMWGAKVHQRRDMIEGLARALFNAGQDQFGSRDQATMDQILWPAAKLDVVIFRHIEANNENRLELTVYS